jgi:16S rRNA (cytosine1402-N4)-methyltransferase
LALELAEERLKSFTDRYHLVQASYATLHYQLQMLGWETVDGILLDLGVSSMQLDTSERGFSFLKDADLDMRFDPGNPIRASDLVNGLPEKDLADLIYRYGEERRSREIARSIVRARPISGTRQLANLVAQSISGGRSRRHPATRTFQALRIAVNRELDALQDALPQAISALGSEGRLAVIAYHSLEDRIVKQYFRDESTDCLCPPRQPICTCGHQATIREINRKPIRPTQSEIASNPRARSARLRIAERLSPA